MMALKLAGFCSCLVRVLFFLMRWDEHRLVRKSDVEGGWITLIGKVA